jgi:hypothetical protein
MSGLKEVRPIDELLMPLPAFKALKDNGDLGLRVQSDGAAYLSAAAQIFDFNLKQLAHWARNGKLDGVRLEHGKLLVTPLSSDVPVEADELNRESTHVRTSEPPRNISAMLAGVLADGTNLGPTRMDTASKGISAHQISGMQLFHALSNSPSLYY